jgi:hypothetical protein
MPSQTFSIIADASDGMHNAESTTDVYPRRTNGPLLDSTPWRATKTMSTGGLSTALMPVATPGRSVRRCARFAGRSSPPSDPTRRPVHRSVDRRPIASGVSRVC